MTDRELLELAAKAAGVFMTRDEWPYSDAPTDEDFALHFDEETGTLTGPVLVYNYDGELSGTTHEEWNPLTDDGDALRLAVKLRLDIDHHEACVNVWDGCVGTGFISNGDDPMAATRRAIVRAAAAIGQSGADGRTG